MGVSDSDMKLSRAVYTTCRRKITLFPSLLSGRPSVRSYVTGDLQQNKATSR